MWNNTRRSFLVLLGLVAAGLVLPLRVCAAEGQADKPNIVFILADDK
jgi:hypothetical protein